MLHALLYYYYSLQSYCSSTGGVHALLYYSIPCRATVALQEMLHALLYYSATRSILLLLPVELLQLQRRCYTLYSIITPCRATVALQEMLHALLYYYSLQSYCSFRGDATRSTLLLLPVELLQLYRRCYKLYFTITPCRATVFLRRCYTLYSITILCGATVALQETLHALLYYYALQSYCSSTGDATRSTLLLLPVEPLQLKRRCYTLYSATFICRAAVAIEEMLHALLYYYSLQSYCSSTGDATRSTLLLLLVELYRRCYTLYSTTTPCRATVALQEQEMLQALLYYYSLQSYCSSTGDATRSTLLLLLQSYCSSKGDATRSTLLLLPVEVVQLYRRCYTLYSTTLLPAELLQLYRKSYTLYSTTLLPVERRRCYTLYSTTTPCRAPVALQEMLHALLCHFYLQSYCSYRGDATRSTLLLLPVELLQLYRRCYTLYFTTTPCRALQEMLHALLYYYSLQSYCSSTGGATRSTLLLYFLQSYCSSTGYATRSTLLLFLVELLQLYSTLYSTTTPCRAIVALQEVLHALLDYSTPCRATVALQEMLHALLYYSATRSTLLLLPVQLLQLYRSATRSILLLPPVELLQLYRKCYTLYSAIFICRATVAIEEMLHALLYYYSDATRSTLLLYFLQSYCSSTGDATRSTLLLLPVELLQLYRRCYTLYSTTTPCRAIVALQEMLQALLYYYSLQSDCISKEMLHALLYYYSLWSYCSSTGDATRSTLLLLPVELLQLYRRCYTLYSTLLSVELLQLYRRCYTLYSTTTPCRATVALQELYRRCYTLYSTTLLHALLYYYSLQSYCSYRGGATRSTLLLLPVELLQLYRRCYALYSTTTPCRATVALQEMLHA